MRVHGSILLCLLIFAAACSKETNPVGNNDGYGRIVLTLDNRNALPVLESRATDLQEGNKFDNLLVILTDQAGKVVSKIDTSYASSKTQDTLAIENLLPGNYHIYAYANYTATDWQQGGADRIASQEESVAVGDSFSSYVDRELSSLTTEGTDAPATPASAMLLTADMDVPVGLTTVNCSLNLIRPVVRFKVTVHNNTPFPATVKELDFSPFNPDKAYLLPHTTSDNLPALPAGASYRNLPAYPILTPSLETVSAGSEKLVYETLLYESAYPGLHKVSVTIMLDRSGESLGNLEISRKEREFSLIDYATLSAMKDGERAQVLVMNPQISVRSGRIFAYVGEENNMVWESAGYTNYTDYFNRAKAIYDENASYDYSSRYSYSNANGYSGWDGLDASDGSKATSFSYTGARSKYFHTLTKSGNSFSLEGLALQQGNSNDNGKAVTPFTNFLIEEGAPISGKNPSDMTDGKLIRFRMNNTNDYVQADVLWASNVPNRLTNLKKNASNDSNKNKEKQDRQFILFGKYDNSCALRRILKDNNKEVPLTYLARNEEVNVIINVFYSDQDGTLDFAVDNSSWTTPTTSTHTFN